VHAGQQRRRRAVALAVGKENIADGDLIDRGPLRRRGVPAWLKTAAQA
jgi:hypothetical protein